LLTRARSAWNLVERQRADDRDAEVGRALERTLERVKECSIVTHRAMWLARQAFVREDPEDQAFGRMMTAIDAVDGGGSCACSSVADRATTFGGPPLGDSGGAGGGVTHPAVAAPQ
jgi:hypothetical protein